MGPGGVWSLQDLVSVAVDSLRRASEATELEQSVRGIDALGEVELHLVLADGLARHGFGVFREHPYPGVPGRLPRHAERERCDLVLTPSPGVRPIDPVACERARIESEATLFAEFVRASAEPGWAPEECAWVEIKAVGQHAYRDGIPGPNRSYSSELVGAFRDDLRKLAREPRAGFAAVLVVVFTTMGEVADHDVPVALSRCLDAGCVFDGPSSDGFGISDRIGNRWCSVWAARARGGDGLLGRGGRA